MRFECTRSGVSRNAKCRRVDASGRKFVRWNLRPVSISSLMNPDPERWAEALAIKRQHGVRAPVFVAERAAAIVREGHPYVAGEE